MDVKPLAITQVDWPGYIDFCIQHTGKSPTHNLDAFYMKPDNLGAFMASLQDGRDPRQILRHEARVLNHISLSFMIHCSFDTLAEIVTWDLSTLYYTAGRNDALIIASGSMKQWKEAILLVCIPGTDFESRAIMNKCLLFMEKAGLSEVFGSCKKESLQDETFILKEK